MLVLTRKIEENIVIGDDIVITILGVERDKVKIGISAPRDMVILRGEIYEAVRQQKEIEAKLAEGHEPPGMKSLRAFLAEQAMDTPEDQDPAEKE